MPQASRGSTQKNCAGAGAHLPAGVVLKELLDLGEAHVACDGLALVQHGLKVLQQQLRGEIGSCGGALRT